MPVNDPKHGGKEARSQPQPSETEAARQVSEANARRPTSQQQTVRIGGISIN